MPGNYQHLLVNLEVKRGETLGSLNQLFREMAQEKEKLELIEQQIQVGRGVMDGLEQAQEIIKEQIKADQIADFQEQKAKTNEAKEKEAQEIIAKRKESKSSVFGPNIENKTSVPGIQGFVGGGEKVGQEEHK